MAGALPLTEIETVIRSAAGSDFTLREHRILADGCTHGALEVGDGTQQRYFVKHAAVENAAMLGAEEDGLAALRNRNIFRTPEVLACTTVGSHAFLVLEWLALEPVRSDADGRLFAEALIALHGEHGETFGWSRDNFIGATPQLNSPSDSWTRFVRDCRLRPQLERACANGFAADLQREGERLLPRITALFLDYRPRPSLLHGDLWHGNAAMVGGQPALFDPAVHYGDHEAEHAMCELFGGFPTSFHATLRRLAPPAPGHAERKALYTLYHVLNHLNLFGRSYLGEARRLLTKLNDAIGRS